MKKSSILTIIFLMRLLHIIIQICNKDYVSKNNKSTRVYSENKRNNVQVFDLFSDKDLETGNAVTFTLYGVSKRHHEYLVKLLNATGDNPFQPIPGFVKGNLVNRTTAANYPLGYFSISETARITHLVD